MSGHSASCGCSKRSDITGMRFGRLTAIKFFGLNSHRASIWEFLCDCGVTKNISVGALINGDTQSCGCLGREKARERMAARSRAWVLPKTEGSFNSVWYKYNRGAREREMEFSLTKDEFREVISRNCFYCGREPAPLHAAGKYNGSFVGTGIDRKDNSVGYTKENCIPCCSTCNFAKGRIPFDDFIIWLERIRNYAGPEWTVTTA